jgi:hypothetical protein
VARSVGRTDGRRGSPNAPEITTGLHRQVSPCEEPAGISHPQLFLVWLQDRHGENALAYRYYPLPRESKERVTVKFLGTQSPLIGA